MVMPNFIIIGAAKAGTSSLYSYLKQHPQIYMSPIKEPRFFALEGETLDFQGPAQGINSRSVTQIEDYCRLFQGVTNEIAIGEASTLYLHSQKAIARIKHYIPKVKLIAILRDPAERAFSSYLHLVRDGYETLSFAEGLDAEESRIRQKWQPLWYYQQRGFYADWIKRYFAAFEREQIKIYLYDDLVVDTSAVVKDIYQFLGVDEDFTPELTRENVSGIPKNKVLQTIMTKENPIKSVLKPLLPKTIRQSLNRSITQKNLGKKTILDSDIREKLVDMYKPDIIQLQTLLGLDLAKWMK